MADAVETKDLLAHTRAFLADLAANNTRDWFKANKSRYDAQLKRPAERLMADLALVLERDYGAPVRSKLFRPHRDVRFSEDKTPYNTHLHMMWALPDSRTVFFGIAQDYASVGAGIMTFDEEQLNRWRAAMDAEPGAELDRLLHDQAWRLAEPELDRVPAPFPADHPRQALLRRKGLVAWADGLDDSLAADPRDALETGAARLKPLMAWLDAHVTG